MPQSEHTEQSSPKETGHFMEEIWQEAKPLIIHGTSAMILITVAHLVSWVASSWMPEAQRSIIEKSEKLVTVSSIYLFGGLTVVRLGLYALGSIIVECATIRKAGAALSNPAPPNSKRGRVRPATPPPSPTKDGNKATTPLASGTDITSSNATQPAVAQDLPAEVLRASTGGQE